MLSFDDRQRSVTKNLQQPGLVSQLSPVEQLPFPEYSPSPARTTRHLEYDISPGVTGPLSDPSPSPGETGILTEVHTDTLPSPFAKRTTTALRQPVVIRGTGKKSISGIIPPPSPKGRRWVVNASVISIMLLIGLLTAIFVVPAGGETGHGFNPFQLVANLVQNSSNSPNFIAQQAATATAVTRQDGYDPGAYQGVVPQPGPGGPYRFAFGQCTYWANMRYHDLTGYWVPWLGNAYEWTYGAQISGWVVSSTPVVPSIIVLSPGVQGASGYGHVAIVEAINKDGSVYTSDMNWYDGGGWDRVSYYTFHPGSGVHFVWHP